MTKIPLLWLGLAACCVVLGAAPQSTPGQVPRDFLNVISQNTGGFAIVSTNDAGPGIEQMFRENGS
jgi:hypothetical protein